MTTSSFTAGHSGHAPHDAQDWAQSFFEYLLENRVIGKARQDKRRCK